MEGDPTVVDLVFRARDGDNSAWNDLVDRYAPLVWGICRAHRLSDADADDVGQNVWLLLVEHLAAIREPAALPGWLATTTRRECLRSLRVKQQGIRASTAVENALTVEPAASPAVSPVEDLLLTEERNTPLRAAFRQLPSNCQQLLALLLHDPPLPYAEISKRLGMKIGGLGPRRARCLNKLRRCPPLAELIESATSKAGEW
jgi:RNA polymerase sigma factor (sigma-70 family)